jgi:hypothetical protein
MEKQEQSPEMARFRSALGKVLKVSKDEMKSLLSNDIAKDALKQKQGRRPKHAAKP